MRTHYFMPLVRFPARKDEPFSETLVNSNLAGIQGCRQLASALTARALLRVGDDSEGAWQDLQTAHRLARLVGRGGTVIEALTAMGIDADATEADLAFLQAAKLDARALKKCLRDLQDLPPLPAMADKFDLTERFTYLDAVMHVNRTGALEPDDIPDNVVIKWDPALRTGNRVYTRMATALRIKDRNMREEKLQEIEADFELLRGEVRDVAAQFKAVVKSKDSGEALGQLMGGHLLNLLAPAVRRIQHAADRAEQRQTNLHIAFALAAFKADSGKYPQSLDPLAPKYLPTVPPDLFSGKALIYRPNAKGYLLYSVGINGKDDGGRGPDDDPPGDDLVVRMPLPRSRDR
jgi:hypothetical protein